MKKLVYALFIDLTTAFNHVNRDLMLKIIRQRFPSMDDKKLMKLLQLYKHTTTSLSQSPRDEFKIQIFQQTQQINMSML